MLPKGALHHIQSSTRGKPAKIAWSTITLQKSEGGLGLQDIGEWDLALILKHLLNIINPQSSSLWAKWIRKTRLKRSSFWVFKKPLKCSWILHKVLCMHDTALSYVTYSTGNGNHTSLWFDPWHNVTPIWTLNDPIISHTHSATEATVSTILRALDGVYLLKTIWIWLHGGKTFKYQLLSAYRIETPSSGMENV